MTVANDDRGSVVAAFASTIGAIRRLPIVADNPQLSGYPDAQLATLCYIDGQIPKAPPPLLSGTLQPSFDRAVIVVVGEQSYFIAAGYRENVPIQSP